MKRSLLAVLPVAVIPLAGCPSGGESAPPDAPSNPAVLWLALDGSELEVRLVAEEPRPF